MIRITDLTFSYGNKDVFDRFNAVFDDGITCLMGPSGCGKTTLMRLIAGLETPQSGTIEGLTSRPVMMFQEDRLLPWMSAFENAAIGLRPSDKRKAAVLLEELEVDENLMPDQLSGGMARRVALARALAMDTDVLLLDEPFKGLDPGRINKAAQLIQNSRKIIIASTHSQDEADALGSVCFRLQP